MHLDEKTKSIIEDALNRKAKIALQKEDIREDIKVVAERMGVTPAAVNRIMMLVDRERSKGESSTSSGRSSMRRRFWRASTTPMRAPPMRESPVGILEECADWLESEAQGYRNRALHALKMGQKGSADALLE
jgi:hypothetical protein